MESKPRESLRALESLTRNYPESQYIDEVQFRRGENLFVLRQYSEAEAAYGDVVKNYPDSLFFEKALYKYGWANIVLLSRIDGRMTPRIDAERQYLLTNLYLHKQQYKLAEQSSQKINQNSIWSLYARYNFAVSQLENNQPNKSKQELDNIGQMSAESTEKLALRDQVNFALGLSYLKQKQPKAALAKFSRIRLQGPLSNEALLGAGWAWNNLNQPQKALVPWLELANLNTIDAATQEALLAIPTSLEQSQKFDLAVQYYELAANKFDAQLDILDQVIETIKQNELIQVLEQQVFVNDRTSFERFPLDSSTTPYLHILFASERFQQEVKRYQDLLDIRASLLRWDSNLPVLALMLKERRKHFKQKLPLLEQSSTFGSLEKLQKSRDRLALKLSTVEAEGDYFSLATAEENQLLQRLEKVELALGSLAGKRNIESQRDMHRLLSGLLRWKIGTDYASRLWRARKQLKELDLALDESRLLVQSLSKVSLNANNEFSEFERRLAGKQDQISHFRQRVTDLIQRQEKRINKLAVLAIRQQQQHIVQLRLNTRYAMTSLFDRLVSD